MDQRSGHSARDDHKEPQHEYHGSNHKEHRRAPAFKRNSTRAPRALLEETRERDEDNSADGREDDGAATPIRAARISAVAHGGPVIAGSPYRIRTGDLSL